MSVLDPRVVEVGNIYTLAVVVVVAAVRREGWSREFPIVEQA